MKKIICYIIYYLFKNPVLAARFIGVRIGEHCAILDNPWKVFGSEPYLIEIGNYVKITNGVRFATHDGGIWCLRNANNQVANLEVFGRIIIKSNVFIGIGSTILLNSVINDNVVIGAMSLVKGELEANSVYCGVPVKKIRPINDYLKKSLCVGVQTKNLSRKKKKVELMKKR